jgi:hypothetical protein
VKWNLVPFNDMTHGFTIADHERDFSVGIISRLVLVQDFNQCVGFMGNKQAKLLFLAEEMEAELGIQTFRYGLESLSEFSRTGFFIFDLPLKPRKKAARVGVLLKARNAESSQRKE